MKIYLEAEDIVLLKKAEIPFTIGQKIDIDSALAFLDSIYDQEVFYAQGSDTNIIAAFWAKKYAELADKVHAQIEAADEE